MGGRRGEEMGESGENNGFGRSLYKASYQVVGGGGDGELCEEALTLFG